MDRERLNRLLEALADWPELLEELRRHPVWGAVLRGEPLEERPPNRRSRGTPLGPNP